LKPTKPANINSKVAVSIDPATCPSLPPELEDEEELELLEEELELLEEELELELLEELEGRPVDELEELELELDEELLVDLRTKIELRVALSVLVVSAISSFPSVTLASKVFFNAVLAPTSAKMSTLVSTRAPSIATLNERALVVVWYISTKPNSTE
jgi:hypothetical protein